MLPFAELLERGEAARWHWANALEAADLTLADLIGAPRPARDFVNRGLAWTTQRWRSA